MLEGVQNVLGRIKQIEGSFQARSGSTDANFQAAFSQAQAAVAGANYSPAGANPAMAGAIPGMPATQQPYLNNVNPGLWGLINPLQATTGTGSAMYNVAGTQLANLAAAQEGRQYWSNACAHAVNDVLKNAGIDISSKVKNNPNWVPNYADLGDKVTTMSDLKPGDLVIYNNYLGQGGYDHIGIYAGNGEAYNVSTSSGYKFVKSPIGSRFQEGRRITTPN